MPFDAVAEEKAEVVEAVVPVEFGGMSKADAMMRLSALALADLLRTVFVEPVYLRQPEIPRGSSPWQRVLLLAADEIVRRGWCQGSFLDELGRVCAGGAINNALMTLFSNGDVRHALQGSLAERLRDYLGMDLVSWNDQPGRTKAEVVTALRTCARRG